MFRRFFILMKQVLLTLDKIQESNRSYKPDHLELKYLRDFRFYIDFVTGNLAAYDQADIDPLDKLIEYVQPPFVVDVCHKTLLDLFLKTLSHTPSAASCEAQYMFQLRELVKSISQIITYSHAINLSQLAILSLFVEQTIKNSQISVSIITPLSSVKEQLKLTDLNSY